MIYFAVTLIFAQLCLLQGALLKQDGFQAVSWKKHEDTEALARRIEKRDEEVTIEMFDDHVADFETEIAALSDMMNMINAELLSLTQDLSSANQAIGTINGQIATLEDNYTHKTVKNCISGVIIDSVPGKYSFTFDPPFSSTPTLLYALSAYDAGSTTTRFDISVDSLTASGCTLDVRTWSASGIAWAETRYLACR